MHRFKIIHQNNIGFVSKCDECGKIQFKIGNVVSHLPEKHFHRLYENICVEQKFPHLVPVELHQQKYISIPSPEKNFVLAFSMNQFMEVKELLSVSSLIIRAQKLIRFYQ